jgi:hypothetical protein
MKYTVKQKLALIEREARETKKLLTSYLPSRCIIDLIGQVTNLTDAYEEYFDQEARDGLDCNVWPEELYDASVDLTSIMSNVVSRSYNDPTIPRGLITQHYGCYLVKAGMDWMEHYCIWRQCVMYHESEHGPLRDCLPELEEWV